MCKFMHEFYLYELCEVIHGHINLSRSILVSHIKYLLIQPHPHQATCAYLRIYQVSTLIGDQPYRTFKLVIALLCGSLV